MVFLRWCYGNLHEIVTAVEQFDRDGMCDMSVYFHRANNHTAHLSTRSDLKLDLNFAMDPIGTMIALIGVHSEAWTRALIVLIVAWTQTLTVAWTLTCFVAWTLTWFVAWTLTWFVAWTLTWFVELLLDLVAIRGAIQATHVALVALVALVAFVAALTALVAFVAFVAAFVTLMMIFYYVCGLPFFYL